jgi:hypothetical protein
LRTFHHDGKLAQAAVRVGVARPPTFTQFTITYKVVVYAPAEWADTLTLFHLLVKVCTLWFEPSFVDRDKKQTRIDLRGISTNWFKNQLWFSTRLSRLRALIYRISIV